MSESAAYRTIVGHYSKFKESGVNAKKLASTLYKKELISRETYSKVTESESDEEKLEIIYDEVKDNTLVKDGYFDRFVKCLMNDTNDEQCTTIAQSLTSTYQDMVTHRENVFEGVKERLSDGAKYVRKKVAQVQEKVVAFSYAAGEKIAKEKFEGNIEEDSDLNDDDKQENLQEGASNEDNEGAVETAQKNVCLHCLEPVIQEEEPVHEACLPNFPLCIRCQTNKRRDQNDHYCAHCLIYPKVSICHYCSNKTNGSPVHFSCLEHYAWCLRCLEQAREHPKFLCTDCEETNDETSQDDLQIETDDIVDDVFDEPPTRDNDSPDDLLNEFPESLPNEPDFSGDLDRAIREGHTIKVRWSKLCVSGPPGSGKSSILKLLLDELPLHMHTSTLVLAASGLPHVSPLLMTEDVNCTWESADDIRALLCEAIRSRIVTPADGDLYTDEEDSHSPVSRERFVCRSMPIPGDNEAEADNATSPIVAEMKDLLRNLSIGHFFNAPSPTYHFIFVVEAGGQAAFFDVAPALLQHNSVHIITHKLDEKLNSKVNYFYEVDDEGYEERQLTHMQLLISTIRSSTSVIPLELRGVTIKQVKNSRSKLIVLGTYYDKICHFPESLESKNILLKANTMQNKKQLFSYEDENLVFPVNAAARGKYEANIATKIRKHVCESYTEVDVPIKWFLFQLHLQGISQSVARKEKCHEIGSKFKMGHDEVDAALLYLHNLTVFFYVPEILPDCVFLHPQLLNDKLTQLISASSPNSRIKFENRGISLPCRAHQQFQKEGVFTFELLACICEHFKDMDCTVMEFLQLMEGLALIVEIPHPDGDYMFFFPSVLPTLQTDSTEFHYLLNKYKEELQPLILSWPIGIIPQGLFPALIVRLLSRPDNSTQFKLKEVPFLMQQYRNAIQLECINYGGSIRRGGSVLLIDTIYKLEVYYVSELHGKIDRWESCFIREAVFEEIRNVVQLFNYDPSLAVPTMSFICLKHEGKGKHFRQISDDKKNTWCIVDKSVMEMDMLQQKPWLQKTNLDITDLNEVLSLLDGLTLQWNRLGLELGLRQHTLDIIQENHARDVEKCFRKCLEKWLEKADNVQSVTWVSLADALRRIPT